jgi:hypothetical protein
VFKPGSRQGVWLTVRDRQMLSFMAEHRMVLESQVVALLGTSSAPVQRRLRVLAGVGYLSRQRVFEDSYRCRILRRGLAAIGSELPPPEVNLGAHKHDVGVAWLWLAARDGAFGPAAEVLGERRLRSHDEAGTAPEQRYTIRLGGYTGKGAPRRHYPDLLLVDGGGRRLALELELSPKKASRREEILAAYGADRLLDGVVYLVEDNRQGRSIGRAIRDSADRMGLQERVHVRLVSPIELGADKSRVRSPGRQPRRGPSEAVL